ncbi:hypothetical protein ISF_08023 [Cordyceps fumosorosea ARSEF 2679]|uniref:Copper acquisition factor BIM1-like domain-containing protein n=1 Tax=Cordyceps fumosorosea (strain ARSEF 2679) TaxID=1081104 RepID=A0A167N3X3_CORFA|nr:hypothetical protein ISF_08023 [Cordyceps fumosorosea ARSEF 2679]OAA55102.1 hypothetical protein ISF_08023 [Cordyceps fumosorosea ARSEF 2679]
MKLNLLISLALAGLAAAHTVISYPGWRGNNLITNDTFPYGMQWMYPCGGMGVTKNRTYWPIGGGTVAFQPGWFRGHSLAFVQINLGFGSDPSVNIHGGPPNMSNPMIAPFQIIGPSNNPYPGTVCLTQVPLPAGAKVKAGDEATIQVVETAQHGAALYSVSQPPTNPILLHRSRTNTEMQCVDIIFAEQGDPRIAPVNESNCYNSTDIGFAQIYTITTKDSGTDNYTTSAAERTLHSVSWVGWTPLLFASAALLLL